MAARITKRKIVSGIYRIEFLPTGRNYIGSSRDVWWRLKDHKRMLRRGEHHNTRLQKDWNAHHPFDFRFILIKRCPKSELRIEEQLALNKYKSYNVKKVAARPSKQTRKLMSKAALKVGRDKELHRIRSENAKKQHAAGNLGRKTWGKKFEKKVIQRIKESWKDPNKFSLLKNRRCSKCGGKGVLLKHKGKIYCQPCDPVIGRNYERNLARSRAQKAITNRTMSESTKRKLSKALLRHHALKRRNHI